MASCLSVLRLVSPQDSRVEDMKSPSNLVRERLMQQYDLSSADPPNNPQNDSTVISISNRYFSADVALLEGAAMSAKDGASPEAPRDLPHKEDGILLVWYDHSHVDDFTSLLSLAHDKAVAAGGGDLLRLCVGIQTGHERPQPQTPKEIEEEYAKRVLWCLNRGYEYIPSCDLTEEGVKQGHEERDKEGFARLVEAIQGTVWSSAVMTKSTESKLKSSYEIASRQVETSGANDVDEEEERNAYEPPDPSMLLPLATTVGKGDEDRERQAKEELLKDVGEGSSSSVQNVSDSNVASELENERLFDRFEGAIQEASRIRDMSRTGELSDEDRRKRAGDAALMLVNLLEQMGYDEGDEDAEDSSNDEAKEEKVAG